MKITRFGHSCMLVEENDARLLIDPGSFSAGFETLTNIDAIFVSHEHQDHFTLENLRTIKVNNSDAQIFTNEGVGAILEKENIPFTRVGAGGEFKIAGVSIEIIGSDHACIHHSIPLVRNNGYIIADKFYFPGDALTLPGKRVDFLALPIMAPWMRLEEAIDFAVAVGPKICFPVHDGLLKHLTAYHNIPTNILSKEHIEFRVIPPGGSIELN